MNTETETEITTSVIPDRLFFRIGDVAELAAVKPHVLRYWETEFPMISPTKSPTGQRVYRRSDVESILLIKHLLYRERYSIEGARRRIRELRRGGELRKYKDEKIMGVAPSAAATKAEASEVRESHDEAVTFTAQASELHHSVGENGSHHESETTTEFANIAAKPEVLRKIRSVNRELGLLLQQPVQNIFRW